MDYQVTSPFERFLFSHTDPFCKESARLLVQTSKEVGFPVRIRSRETDGLWGAYWKALHWICFVFTFGRVKLLSMPYIMVFAGIIWLPKDGAAFSRYQPKEIYRIFAHETTHLLDKYTGIPEKLLPGSVHAKPSWQWLRRWLFDLLYLVWPLPLFFCTFRAKVEYFGYKRDLFLSIHEHFTPKDPSCVSLSEYNAFLKGNERYLLWRGHVHAQLVSATYGWMYTSHSANKALDDMEKEWFSGECCGHWNSIWKLYRHAE